MARWATTIQRTASTTLAVGSLTAAAANMRRAKVSEFSIGCEAATADNAYLWQVQRCTTAGTAGTNPTPVALDAGDTLACTIVIGQAHTVDPTGTTVLLSIPLNQRASFRWVAYPGGELIIPATASNGLKWETPTAGGLLTVTAGVHFEEL